jgi:hypothetical protein
VSRLGKKLVSIAAFTEIIREEDAGNKAVIKTVCISGLHRVFIGFMGFIVWVGLNEVGGFKCFNKLLKPISRWR